MKDKPKFHVHAEVLRTVDYDMFTLLRGNRNTNPAHLKRLEMSFQRNYLFSPILVNERYEIIDGQHRYIICRKLNLPLYYIVVHGYGLNEVQILNTNTVNWKKIDYLSSYCDMKYPEYLKFRHFMNLYPGFNLTSVENLLKLNVGTPSSYSPDLKSETNKAGNYRIKTFEEGEFVCRDFDNSCKYADQILEMEKYNSTVVYRTSFVSTMIRLFKNENYDHDSFLAKLSLQPTALSECVNKDQYITMIEEIYNYKRRPKVNLRY